MGSAGPLEGRLGAAGFNLRGVLDPGRYDALVPTAWRAATLGLRVRSVWVIASGGRALWQAFECSPEFGVGADPLDAYTRRVLAEAVAGLARDGHPSRALLACERRGGEFADFVALGREAGLGAPSRLGLLVHPEYGPWLSIRALLLSTRPLPSGSGGVSEGLTGFDPCPTCPAPCAVACPGSAPTPAGFDLGACDATRESHAPCADDCAARRACVLGPDHAYRREALAHHMRRSRPT